MVPKILIVEDYKPISEIFSRVLSYSGYKIWTTESVNQTREFLIGDIIPDLIILDLQLSDGSSISILEMVKSNPRFSHVKVVVVSANTQILWDWEKTSDYSPDFVILKPVGSRELQILIKQQLKNWRPDKTTKQKTTEEQPCIVVDNKLHVDWGDIRKKSIIVKYPAQLNWEDFAQLRQGSILPLLDSVSHPVHYILDFSETSIVPPNTLHQVRQFINSTHPNFSGLMMIVDATAFLRHSFEFTNMNHHSKAKYFRMMFVNKIEDALQMTRVLSQS